MIRFWHATRNIHACLLLDTWVWLNQDAGGTMCSHKTASTVTRQHCQQWISTVRGLLNGLCLLSPSAFVNCWDRRLFLLEPGLALHRVSVSLTESSVHLTNLGSVCMFPVIHGCLRCLVDATECRRGNVLSGACMSVPVYAANN